MFNHLNNDSPSVWLKSYKTGDKTKLGLSQFIVLPMVVLANRWLSLPTNAY